MITREECCCDEMFNAVSSINKVPINLDPYEKYNRLYFSLEFIDAYNPEKWESLGEVVADGIAY